MRRKHFHTFDALRFFSFLLVFLLHIPKTGIPYIDYFLNSGGIGVLFFFVLSGFLITYILLHEKFTKGNISLKKFFLRRILRIWPLFYLMIAFAFISPYILEVLNLPFNTEGYKPHLVTSLLFAENYKMMVSGTFPDGAPLRVMWSLCIEEHFYIIWGIAIYLLPRKHVPLLILTSIIIAHIARLIYINLSIHALDIFSHLDYFAFGAIPAYLILHKERYIQRLALIPKWVKYLFLFFTVAMIFILSNNNDLMTPFAPLLLGLFFSITILFTLGKNAIHIKDNLWFSRLGTYTYGLYLYHTIVILLLIQLFKLAGYSSWLLLVSASLILTIIVSIASYYLYEKQFLKLKNYFY